VKLATSGKPSDTFSRPVVGKVSREHRTADARTNVVLVTEELPSEANALSGYAGFVTTARLGPKQLKVPSIENVQEIEHLRTGDIVALEPKNGFIRTLYRPDSDNNVIFTTQRCNSNCLMCSQPPQDRDDVEASARRNLKLIELIDVPPKRLVITGGEPTLLGEHLVLHPSKTERLPSVG
jgi:sulfatase maturation enzyme AslB (radical SAM superfamily)